MTDELVMKTELIEEPEVQADIKPKKPKKQRTEAQLNALTQARQKALEVRRANKKIRDDEKELARLEKAERNKTTQDRLAVLRGKPDEEVAPTPALKKSKKVKKQVKKIVYVSDTSSSEEEEEVIEYRKRPKQKQKVVRHAEPPKPQPKPISVREQMYNARFG